MSHNGRHDDDLQTATAVFERVFANLEGRPATTSTNGHTLPGEARVRLTQVRSAAARTLDLYGELFQRAFETYADLAQTALQPGTDPSPGTPLELSGRVGRDTVTPVWVHNLSADVVDQLELFVTDLTAPTGARIAATAGRFEPSRLHLDAGESGSALLHVAIPEGVQPGLYHGHVLSVAVPHAALAVRLEVEP